MAPGCLARPEHGRAPSCLCVPRRAGASRSATPDSRAIIFLHTSRREPPHALWPPRPPRPSAHALSGRRRRRAAGPLASSGSLSRPIHCLAALGAWQFATSSAEARNGRGTLRLLSLCRGRRRTRSCGRSASIPMRGPGWTRSWKRARTRRAAAGGRVRVQHALCNSCCDQFDVPRAEHQVLWLANTGADGQVQVVSACASGQPA